MIDLNLAIVPVTPENRTAAENMEVEAFQKDFIETTVQCLAEADSLSDWEPVCLMDGDTPVGFAMYGLIRCEDPARVWFDRLLIDRHFQHRGYGRAAVQEMISRLHSEFPGQDIFLSAYENNLPAIRLYQEFGFRFNGELDTHGEKVMVLPADL